LNRQFTLLSSYINGKRQPVDSHIRKKYCGLWWALWASLITCRPCDEMHIGFWVIIGCSTTGLPFFQLVLS
jgi:hypothetical protein